MIAHARIALGAATVETPGIRNLADYKLADVTGEGPDWVSAKAACQIPDGALILSWTRG